MRTIDLFTLVHRRKLRRTYRQSKARRRAGRLGLGLLAVLFLAAAAGLGAVSYWYSSLTGGLPTLADLPAFFDPGEGLFFQPTRLYDRTGQHLLLTLENPGIVRRYMHVDPTEADHFSPELLRAAVALLDPTFWSNPGFHSGRLLDPQPATLAERLAYDLFLSQEPAGLRRALRMRLLAAQLVSQYGRSKVLEWYLNSASFGHLTYGAEAAARLYLDKSASELTLADAALLIPLTSAPALNPLDSPNAAVERQQAALEQLLAEKAISPDEYQRASASEVRLRKETPAGKSSAAAFTSLALDQLARCFGRQRLERGGLRIITSLDYDLQLEMTCLVRTQLRRLEGLSGQESLPDGSECQSARLLPTLPPGDSLPPGLAAAGTVLDPSTGQVLALLGDTTLESEPAFAAAHSPGSLLTPIAAAAAFARSYGPASLVWDIPSGLAQAANPDGVYHGPLRLRAALANDYLSPLAQMVDQIGPASAWRLAAALGLPALAEEQSADVLFSGAKSTPVELAQAYSAFANLGTLNGQRLPGLAAIQPVTVLYVEDAQQRILLDATTPEAQPVLSPPLAYLVHHVLSDEQSRWPTLGYPNPLEVGRPAGAKVGRVEGGQEAWAAGYIRRRVAVLWLGSRQARVDPRFAAGIWHALIQFTARDLPAEDWPPPQGVSTVNVCDPSGQLPTAACPAVVAELFLAGNEPVSYDSLYQTYQVNRETGRLATVFTPAGLVDERVYMQVPPEARAWAAAAGIQTPPDVYDAIQPPAPSENVQISSPAPFAYVRGKVALRGTARGAGFSSYRLQAGAGLNPQSWLQIAPDSSTPASDQLLAEWDTQGLDGLYALRLLVVRADQTVENATIQVTVDNTPPVARVIYPLPGQAFNLPRDRQVTFQAEASDAVGIQKVEWLVDGKPAGQNLVAPWSYTWQASPGEHTLAVRVTDLAGNLTESAQVKFQVNR